MPLLHQSMFAAFARDGHSVKLPTQSDGEIANVDHLLHFAERLLANLARLQRDQFR